MKAIMKMAMKLSVQQMFSSFNNSLRRNISTCVVIHPQVQEALEKKFPLVALESAIITHGMQYPLNLQTALDVENIIKEEGAIPATIGIIDGKVHIGLTEDQIHFLAMCTKDCFKVSRRDFPYVLSKGFHGGTTVAGTMCVCHLVGIPLFVTGGIGGVHHHGEVSMDISADLTELGRCPVAVVSAGVKSFLDVGQTLEYLETQGVCVATVGSSRAFPDFFTRDSGFVSPYCVTSPFEAALLMFSRLQMELESGMLLAVPIPAQQEANGLAIKHAIDVALGEASKAVRGRDVTPFVLRRIAEITEGKSVLVNVDLVRNNARIGARVAVEYGRLLQPKLPHYRVPPSREDYASECKLQPVGS